VPAALLLFIAFAQIGAWSEIKYHSQMKAPQHIIEVSARQFEWRIRYPDDQTREEIVKDVEPDATNWPNKKAGEAWGHAARADFNDLYVVNEVHTWQGANTRVYLKTRDVLHSFFLPVMRLKQDAVPGKIIPVWFKPTDYNGEWKDGKWVYARDDKGNDKVWELACAELCGWGHYKMQGRLYVHKDKESYKAWLADALAKGRATTREEKK
jgi:cytochrome c oxidase subunit 2